jgi:hypothetical protein
MSIAIKRTNEHRLFYSSNTNREVNESHVAALVRSMRQWGFLPSCPLRVHRDAGRYVIDDGQHRFTAASRLGIPIYYVCEDAEVPASVTSGLQKKWQPVDFATSYAQQGKNDYQYLRSFCEQNGLPLATAAKILAGKTTNGNSTRAFRAGDFEVSEDNVAHTVVEVAKAIEDAGANWARHNHALLAVAAVLGVPGVSSTQLIARIRSNPSLLVKQGDRDHYIRLFDSIYNYRTSVAQRVAIEHACKASANARRAAKASAE